MTHVEKFFLYPTLTVTCFVSGYFTHLALTATSPEQFQLLRLQKDVNQIQQLLLQLKQYHQEDLPAQSLSRAD